MRDQKFADNSESGSLKLLLAFASLCSRGARAFIDLDAVLVCDAPDVVLCACPEIDVDVWDAGAQELERDIPDAALERNADEFPRGPANSSIG